MSRLPLDEDPEAVSVRLSFPPEPEVVVLARAAATAVGTTCTWLPASRVDDLRLAVSEAVTNAVLAQRRGDIDATLHVDVVANGAALSVVVTDSAGGFDPTLHLEAAPAPTGEGGRGLGIMSRFVDELHFSQTDQGTVVELRVIASS